MSKMLFSSPRKVQTYKFHFNHSDLKQEANIRSLIQKLELENSIYQKKLQKLSKEAQRIIEQNDLISNEIKNRKNEHQKLENLLNDYNTNEINLQQNLKKMEHKYETIENKLSSDARSGILDKLHDRTNIINYNLNQIQKETDFFAKRHNSEVQLISKIESYYSVQNDLYNLNRALYLELQRQINLLKSHHIEYSEELQEIVSSIEKKIFQNEVLRHELTIVSPDEGQNADINTDNLVAMNEKLSKCLPLFHEIERLLSEARNPNLDTNALNTSGMSRDFDLLFREFDSNASDFDQSQMLPFSYFSPSSKRSQGSRRSNFSEISEISEIFKLEDEENKKRKRKRVKPINFEQGYNLNADSDSSYCIDYDYLEIPDSFEDNLDIIQENEQYSNNRPRVFFPDLDGFTLPKRPHSTRSMIKTNNFSEIGVNNSLNSSQKKDIKINIPLNDSVHRSPRLLLSPSDEKNPTNIFSENYQKFNNDTENSSISSGMPRIPYDTNIQNDFWSFDKYVEISNKQLNHYIKKEEMEQISFVDDIPTILSLSCGIPTDTINDFDNAFNSDNDNYHNNNNRSNHSNKSREGNQNRQLVKKSQGHGFEFKPSDIKEITRFHNSHSARSQRSNEYPSHEISKRKNDQSFPKIITPVSKKNGKRVSFSQRNFRPNSPETLTPLKQFRRRLPNINFQTNDDSEMNRFTKYKEINDEDAKKLVMKVRVYKKKSKPQIDVTTETFEDGTTVEKVTKTILDYHNPLIQYIVIEYRQRQQSKSVDSDNTQTIDNNNNNNDNNNYMIKQNDNYSPSPDNDNIDQNDKTSENKKNYIVIRRIDIKKITSKDDPDFSFNESFEILINEEGDLIGKKIEKTRYEKNSHVSIEEFYDMDDNLIYRTKNTYENNNNKILETSCKNTFIDDQLQETETIVHTRDPLNEMIEKSIIRSDGHLKLHSITTINGNEKETSETIFDEDGDEIGLKKIFNKSNLPVNPKSLQPLLSPLSYTDALNECTDFNNDINTDINDDKNADILIKKFNIQLNEDDELEENEITILDNDNEITSHSFERIITKPNGNQIIIEISDIFDDKKSKDGQNNLIGRKVVIKNIDDNDPNHPDVVTTTMNLDGKFSSLACYKEEIEDIFDDDDNLVGKRKILQKQNENDPEITDMIEEIYDSDDLLNGRKCTTIRNTPDGGTIEEGFEEVFDEKGSITLHDELKIITYPNGDISETRKQDIFSSDGIKIGSKTISKTIRNGQEVNDSTEIFFDKNGNQVGSRKSLLTKNPDGSEIEKIEEISNDESGKKISQYNSTISRSIDGNEIEDYEEINYNENGIEIFNKKGSISRTYENPKNNNNHTNNDECNDSNDNIDNKINNIYDKIDNNYHNDINPNKIRIEKDKYKLKEYNNDHYLIGEKDCQTMKTVGLFNNPRKRKEDNEEIIENNESGTETIYILNDEGKILGNVFINFSKDKENEKENIEEDLLNDKKQIIGKKKTTNNHSLSQFTTDYFEEISNTNNIIQSRKTSKEIQCNNSLSKILTNEDILDKNGEKIGEITTDEYQYHIYDQNDEFLGKKILKRQTQSNEKFIRMIEDIFDNNNNLLFHKEILIDENGNERLIECYTDENNLDKLSAIQQISHFPNPFPSNYNYKDNENSSENNNKITTYDENGSKTIEKIYSDSGQFQGTIITIIQNQSNNKKIIKETYDENQKLLKRSIIIEDGKTGNQIHKIEENYSDQGKIEHKIEEITNDSEKIIEESFYDNDENLIRKVKTIERYDPKTHNLISTEIVSTSDEVTETTIITPDGKMITKLFKDGSKLIEIYDSSGNLLKHSHTINNGTNTPKYENIQSLFNKTSEHHNDIDITINFSIKDEDYSYDDYYDNSQEGTKDSNDNNDNDYNDYDDYDYNSEEGEIKQKHGKDSFRKDVQRRTKIKKLQNATLESRVKDGHFQLETLDRAIKKLSDDIELAEFDIRINHQKQNMSYYYDENENISIPPSNNSFINENIEDVNLNNSTTKELTQEEIQQLEELKQKEKTLNERKIIKQQELSLIEQKVQEKQSRVEELEKTLFKDENIFEDKKNSKINQILLKKKKQYEIKISDQKIQKNQNSIRSLMGRIEDMKYFQEMLRKKIVEEQTKPRPNVPKLWQNLENFRAMEKTNSEKLAELEDENLLIENENQMNLQKFKEMSNTLEEKKDIERKLRQKIEKKFDSLSINDLDTHLDIDTITTHDEILRLQNMVKIANYNINQRKKQYQELKSKQERLVSIADSNNITIPSFLR